MSFIIKIYFKPFLSMAIIIIIANPIYEYLCRLKVNKNIAASCSIVMINLILILVIIYLGNEIVGMLRELYETNLDIINEILNKIINKMDIDFENMKAIDKLLSIINSNNLSLSTFSKGSNIVDDVTENLIAYFIGNLGAFFILTDKEYMINNISNILPKKVFKKISKQKNNFTAMIKIQCLLVFISTIEIIIGFFILNIQHSLFLGIVCGVLDILPYVGTIIVFIPIIIYNIVMRNYLIAFGLVCMYILIQVVREVLETKYLSNTLEIHPLMILLSVYIGMNLFGILGMLLGPIYCLIAKQILDINS